MNYDLFNDATVTLDDVELWLCTVPRFNDTTAHTRVLNYTENYDTINKIIRAKVDKSFYYLIPDDKENLSRALQPLIKPKFHPLHFVPYRLHQKRLKDLASQAQ